jgi:hypothetical protein
MALEATRAAYAHLSEEVLENYAFGRLPQADLANFEEHILICTDCQKRLEIEDDFANIILQLKASETVPGDSPAPSSSYDTHASNSPLGAISKVFIDFHVASVFHAASWVTGLAGAVVLVIAAWSLLLLRAPSLTAEAVTLKTLRGDDDVAQAHSNRPLDLSLDLGDLSRSAPDARPYRLEMVDAVGGLLWTKTAVSPDSGKIAARVEIRLNAGVYWVRLYSASGKLLREFGLRLE